MDGGKIKNINNIDDSWSAYLKNSLSSLDNSGSSVSTRVFNRLVTAFSSKEKDIPPGDGASNLDTIMLERELISLPEMSVYMIPSEGQEPQINVMKGDRFEFDANEYSLKEISAAAEESTGVTANELIRVARESRIYYEKNKCLPEDTTLLVKCLMSMLSIKKNLSRRQIFDFVQLAYTKNEAVGCHTKEVLKEIEERKKDFEFLCGYCSSCIEYNDNKGILGKFKSIFLAPDIDFKMLLETCREFAEDTNKFCIDYVNKVAKSIAVNETITSENSSLLNVNYKMFETRMSDYSGDLKTIKSQYRKDSDRDNPLFSVDKNGKEVFDCRSSSLANEKLLESESELSTSKENNGSLDKKKLDLNFNSRIEALDSIARHFFPNDKSKADHLSGYLTQLVSQTSYDCSFLMLFNICFHYFGNDFLPTVAQNEGATMTKLSIGSDDTLSATLTYGPKFMKLTALTESVTPEQDFGIIESNQFLSTIDLAIDINNPNKTKIDKIHIKVAPGKAEDVN